MTIEAPARTLRTTALDCIQRIIADLCNPAFPAGLSSDAEAARYAAITSWASTGQQVANGELSDGALHELVQDCIARFDTCEAVLIPA